MKMEHLEYIWSFAIQWYWIPLTILYIGVISTILIENRNPTKTVSWILVIVFVPVLGLITYYLFGQKFKKVQKLKRSSQLQAEKIRKQISDLEPLIDQSIANLEEQIGNLSLVYSYLKNMQISLPSMHNEVELLANGEKMFPELFDAVLHAKESIHLEYYIFDTEGIAVELVELLKQKSEGGVEVRIIVDAFGSSHIDRFFRKYISENFEVQVFLPVTFTSLANSNYRNHRKIAVIDGEIGFIGGINISDRYVNVPENAQKYWRDTAVKIVGEGVPLLQLQFWTSWNLTGGESFELDHFKLKIPDTQRGNVAVSFVASDPGSIAPFNLEAILVAIGEARKKIQLCTPYFIPNDELQTSLMLAVAAGVEVELMIPEKSDSWIVQHASYSFLKPLLQRGVKVFLYQKGFLHAKTINIDGKLSMIGTVNLDTRSFYINYEIASVISGEKFCAQHQRQFEEDKIHCRPLSLERWLRRKKWKRGIDSICRLLAPLL